MCGFVEGRTLGGRLEAVADPLDEDLCLVGAAEVLCVGGGGWGEVAVVLLFELDPASEDSGAGLGCVGEKAGLGSVEEVCGDASGWS